MVRFMFDSHRLGTIEGATVNEVRIKAAERLGVHPGRVRLEPVGWTHPVLGQPQLRVYSLDVVTPVTPESPTKLVSYPGYLLPDFQARPE